MTFLQIFFLFIVLTCLKPYTFSEQKAKIEKMKSEGKDEADIKKMNEVFKKMFILIICLVFCLIT